MRSVRTDHHINQAFGRPSHNGVRALLIPCHLTALRPYRFIESAPVTPAGDLWVAGSTLDQVSRVIGGEFASASSVAVRIDPGLRDSEHQDAGIVAGEVVVRALLKGLALLSAGVFTRTASPCCSMAIKQLALCIGTILLPCTRPIERVPDRESAGQPAIITVLLDA